MSSIATKTIECANGMPGYLALPADRGKAPAVIVLHERYGFVQHPRNVAERFAGLGMVSLAVNAFFKCDFPEGLADGTKRFYITDQESVEFLASAIQALDATSRVDMTKIAVLGMCQTGRHPFVMAAASDAIAAAICWYGAATPRDFETGPYFPKPLIDILADVKCPVLGLFGELDNLIPVSNVRRVRDALEQNNKPFEIAVFKSAPHGFLNETMPARYRREPADLAWQLQMEFLKKVFQGGSACVAQLYQANLSSGQV